MINQLKSDFILVLKVFLETLVILHSITKHIYKYALQLFRHKMYVHFVKVICTIISSLMKTTAACVVLNLKCVKACL